MAELKDVKSEEEYEFVIESNDFHRLPLKQIGNSIFNVKQYYSPKGRVILIPCVVPSSLVEIRNDLLERIEKSEFLYTCNIVTGDILPQTNEQEAFVFLTESLGIALDFAVLQRQGHMKCDVFIALPHQPVLVLTLVDGERESEVARTYNTHVATEVTKILRKFLDENVNVIGGVLSLTDLKYPDSFREQVDKYTNIYSFFVTKCSLLMNQTKYEKVLTAFWAGVAETKSVLVGDGVDQDYLRFLTKEQCIVLVENINNREVTVTCQPGCGASTLMLEVARRLSNLERTLIVCRSEVERDRLKLIYTDTLASSEIGHVDLNEFGSIIDETGTVTLAESGRLWQFIHGENQLLLWLNKKKDVLKTVRKNAAQLFYLLSHDARQRKLKYLSTAVDELYLFDQIVKEYETEFHSPSGLIATEMSTKRWLQGQKSQSNTNREVRYAREECFSDLMEMLKQGMEQQRQHHLFPVIGNLLRQEKKMIYVLSAKTEYLTQAMREEEFLTRDSSTQQFQDSKKEDIEPVGKTLNETETTHGMSKDGQEKERGDVTGKSFSGTEATDIRSQIKQEKIKDVVEDMDVTQLHLTLRGTQKKIDQLEEQLASMDDRVEWEYNLVCLSNKISTMFIHDDVKEIIGEDLLPVPIYQTEKIKKCPDGEKISVPLVHQLLHFQYGKLTNRNIMRILGNVTKVDQAILLHLQSQSSVLEREYGSPVHMVGEIDSPSCRLVSCPSMTLDSDRVYRKLHVSEDGLELENTKRPGDSGGLSEFWGTCSRLPIPLPPSPSTLTTPRYWETRTRVRVEGVVLWWTLLEMGVCGEGEVNTKWFVSLQPRDSWTVKVGGCDRHNGICTQVWSEGRQVGECRTNTMSNTRGTTQDLNYGVVLDVGRGVVAFLDLDREVVLSSLNVQFRESLRPMFSVCTHPSHYTVKMRLVSGGEITMTDTKKHLIYQALSTT